MEASTFLPVSLVREKVAPSEVSKSEDERAQSVMVKFSKTPEGEAIKLPLVTA